jgi:hypothetical protein
MKGEWKLNYPTKGMKSYVADGEIQKSKCVKRHDKEIVTDLPRPMTIPMTSKEKKSS